MTIEFIPLSADALPEAPGTWAPGYRRSVLRVAEKARRFFRLLPPDAPGLCFVGAEFDPESFGLGCAHSAFSASGKGTDLLQSVQSCVGEGVELLSQMAWGSDALGPATPEQAATGLADEALADLLALLSREPANAPLRIRWIGGVQLADRAPVRVPAALCLRNVEMPGSVRPRVKLSSGCGAGPTKERALLHGLLELIERDAVALWWLGGRRGRRLAAAAAGKAAAFLGELRRGVSSRGSWLLDITTDLRVPCVAALSVDERGHGLACGFAAGLDYEDAVRAALLEMCQMELGLRVIELKAAQGGDEALGETDRKHRRRARSFNAHGCELLRPVADEAAPGAPIDRGVDPLGLLADILARHRIDAYVVDLSRPQLGIAAVQALAPRLQPMPSDVVTERLARQIAESGGGFGLTNAIELI